MPNSNVKNPPKTRWHRGAKFLGMAAQLVGQEVKARVKSGSLGSREISVADRVQQMKKFVTTVSELRGAALKAAQLIAVEMQGTFPKEVEAVLSRVADDAFRMDDRMLQLALESGLSLEQRKSLESMDRTAFRAASIGQVHRARSSGREIVLKIQYPGISESVESDIEILAKLLKIFELSNWKQVSFDELLIELKTVFLQETDYELELASLERMRNNFDHDSDYIIPESFPELCSKTVLALSYEPGESISKWLLTNPSVSDRRKIARSLLKLFFREFFEFGFVQTDANLGNFAIRESLEADPKLILLDFGSVKAFEPDFIAGYRQLIAAVLTQNQDEALHVAIRLQMLDVRESALVREAFWRVLQQIFVLFLPDAPVFDGGDRVRTQQYEDSVRASVLEFIRVLEFSPPPRSILFLHRKLGGIFQLVKSMGVIVDVREFLPLG